MRTNGRKIEILLEAAGRKGNSNKFSTKNEASFGNLVSAGWNLLIWLFVSLGEQQPKSYTTSRAVGGLCSITTNLHPRSKHCPVEAFRSADLSSLQSAVRRVGRLHSGPFASCLTEKRLESKIDSFPSFFEPLSHTNQSSPTKLKTERKEL